MFGLLIASVHDPAFTLVLDEVLSSLVPLRDKRSESVSYTEAISNQDPQKSPKIRKKVIDTRGCV